MNLDENAKQAAKYRQRSHNRFDKYDYNRQNDKDYKDIQDEYALLKKEVRDGLKIKKRIE